MNLRTILMDQRGFDFQLIIYQEQKHVKTAAAKACSSRTRFLASHFMYPPSWFYISFISKTMTLNFISKPVNKMNIRN